MGLGLVKNMFMGGLMSNEYIFQSCGDGIEFIGDFDGLYSNVNDPWLQSEGRELQLTGYVGDVICDMGLTSYCEIGSGLGYNVNVINDRFDGIRVCGLDISRIAIEKSVENFNLDFRVVDISKPIDIKDKFDCVCLFNCLWYVMYDLDVVISNSRSLMTEGGVFLIAQKFLLHQKYGNEIFNGIDQCVKYIEKCTGFDVDYHKFPDIEDYYDGVLICK